MATATARRLPNLPSMPKGATTRNWSTCRCGCGGGTQSTFVPGHDARLKALILRNLRGVMTLAEIGEWGGNDTRKAVETALKDRALIKRWNLEGEIAEAKAREKAEEEEANETAEADADEDETDDEDEDKDE